MTPPTSSRTVSLVVLTVASPLALLTFLVHAAWAPRTFAALAVVFPIALMLLGAARGGERRSPLGGTGWTLGLLFVVMAASMAGLFEFRGRPEGAAQFLIYGLFLVPLLISTLGYAWTFDRHGLDEGDLAELRRRFEPPGDEG